MGFDAKFGDLVGDVCYASSIPVLAYVFQHGQVIHVSDLKYVLVFRWLVVLEFNATLTGKVISWHMFLGFLTPVLTQLYFAKPPTTFLTCFCRGERQKYAGKKSRLNRGSNSQPPGPESDTLTTEPPGRGVLVFQWLIFHKGFTLHSCPFRQTLHNLTPKLERLKTT